MNGQGFEKMNIQWFPGHMTKAQRMIEENLKLVDAVCEIIDARIPRSSRNPDIDRLAAGKPRLIILNRVDLADPDTTARWRRAFQAQGLSVLETDARSGRGVNSFVPAVRELLGAGTLAGIQVMPEFIEPMIIMVTPPGGFAVLGVLIAASVALEQHRARKEGRPAVVADSPCDGCAIACGLGDPADPGCARDAADELVAKVEAALEEQPRIVRVEVQGEEADA